MKTLKQVLKRNFETVGEAVSAALTETEANYAQIAEAVRFKMDSATSRESVRYYATQLRKQNVELPTRSRSYEDGSAVGTATTH